MPIRFGMNPEADENLALMRTIDAQFLETPWYGSRQMVRHLRRDVNRSAASALGV